MLNIKVDKAGLLVCLFSTVVAQPLAPLASKVHDLINGLAGLIWLYTRCWVFISENTFYKCSTAYYTTPTG